MNRGLNFRGAGYASVALLTGSLMLAGCERDAASPAAVADSEQQVMAGKVMYRERMAMPEGATVTVTLADVSRADAPARTIAEQHIDNPGQVPVPFELRYLPSAIIHDFPMAYAVRAEIRGADGELLWTTTRRHSVHPGAEDIPRDLSIEVEKVAPVNQSLLSPAMKRARNEGASFWASGNEPGWHLSIYPEQQMVFVGDYGEKRVSVPNPGAIVEGGNTFYEARSQDNVLQVEIAQSACQDSMSDNKYDYTVVVTLNEERFQGCGLDL